MADIQKYFEEFHEEIKLKRFNENSTLIEKRDIILEKLDAGLKENFEKKGEPVPKYDKFDQGSYEMGTGIKPLNGDYDIDVGISFEIAKDDYSDPVEVKKWVFEALDGHTKRVEMRRPCITVYYQKEGESEFHVDLAVYSDEECNSDGKKYLAKGKLNSSSDNKRWEHSEPCKLTDLINEHYSGDDHKQFVRVIRYLKRWKNKNFKIDGNAAPVGIGLTIASYDYYVPKKDLVDPFANKYKYNDLASLKNVVSRMINDFATYYDGDKTSERLKTYLPVAPRCDIFEKMTDLQMADFKKQLNSLLDSLNSAEEEVDPVTACETLRKIFGDDFPVPEKSDTAQKKGPAIITSSSSA
jgi:hypothetical protein